MSALTNIYLSNGILCLLLGVYFLLSSALSPLPARVLGANYLLYAWQNFLAVAILAHTWQAALWLRPMFALALGPALYLYYTAVRHPDKIEPRVFVHFLPVPLVALALLFGPPRWLNLDYLIVGSFFLYLVIALYLLSRGPGSLNGLREYARTAYQWLSVVAGLMAINLLVELVVLLEIHGGITFGRSRTLLVGAGFFLLANALTILLALKRTPLLEWMNQVGEERIGRYLKPPMDETQARAILERFDRLVNERELYKQEGGLTLKQAARLLVIPARQLSESINRIYGGSFSQYLNDRRVEEVKRLIENHPDRAIVDLMLEAGFATKSNFNKEFARVTKMPPGEYRKRLSLTE